MLLAFGFSVLAAILLPIPIEIVLVKPLSDQNFGFLIGTAFAIAAGKTLGAWLIFVFGLNVEGSIRKWSARWRVAAWFVAKAAKFVQRTGYAGLYLLLSVPFMSDTIPIYVYSVFNAEGKALERDMFLLANFLAALNRVAILGSIWFVARPFFPR
jgi:membrane protein YqaA with SNARE-associated domain